MKIDPADLIDSPEVAAILGLKNPKSVSVLRKRPGFPPAIVEKGRCVLWRRQEVEKWAKATGRANS